VGSLTSNPILQSCTDHSEDNQTTPTRDPNTAATSSSQQAQTFRHEQSQQSASRLPSVQYLIHKDPLPYSDDNVSCGGYVGTDKNYTIRMAMDGTGPVSFSQSKPTQGAQGSILSQGLQYGGQYTAPSKDGPIPDPDNFGGTAPGPHFKDGFTTGPVSYFSTHPRAGGVFAVEDSGSHLDTGCTAGSVDYFPTYTRAGGVFAVETSGSRFDTGCTTGSGDYFPTYSETGGVFAVENSGSHFDTGCTTGSGDYFPTYSETGGVFAVENSDSHLDTGYTTGSVDYFPTYVEAGGVFTAEAPDMRSYTGSTAGTVDFRLVRAR